MSNKPRGAQKKPRQQRSPRGRSSARAAAELLARLEIEYRTLAPLGASFGAEVTRQIQRLLDEEGLTLGFPIEHRVKSWLSIEEKVERKALSIRDLSDLDDLVGIRIVLLFQRDLDLTCRIVEGNFTVVEKSDTQDRLRQDQFGYLSNHYIVKLPDEWLSVPTLAHLGGLKAEIQVRTVAQHIWAAASHKLQYKQEQNVPAPVQRAIHRVSALLETVDLEFERVLEQREEYRAGLARAPAAETLSVDGETLNVDLLRSILDSDLPAENSAIDKDDDYAELMSQLMHAGFTTPASVRALIARRKNEILREDRETARRYLAFDSDPTVDFDLSESDQERLSRDVYYTHVGLMRRMLYIDVPSSDPGPMRADGEDN